MKFFPYYLLAAIAFGGAIAKSAFDRWIIRHYLSTRFDLIEVYHAGGMVAILGSGIAVSILLLVTRQRLAVAIRHEAIALLRAQTGRDDLPSGYRAAIAYVAEDLKGVQS
jgi:hypothetical protein